MSDRWQKESNDFLDALTGGSTTNPLEKKSADKKGVIQDTEKARKLRQRQLTAGGRPRLDSPAADPLVVYNFKIKKSELEALRSLSLDKTLTIRELLSEAVADLLQKYKESER